ncbi:MAG TPA: LysR family transcriptional regulator [Acetobacteraceae bacterium]|nr:LysR family transcriptional regulator [Acetobacteraceae bacterium]
MTLEQLRIFVAVAEREHVTRAAEALNLTQSATSAAIQALERQYETKLFHRVGRGVALTEAGRTFLSEARAVLARAAAAELALSELAGLKRGSLAVQASQTIASYWLPPLLVRFRAAWPLVSLHVSVGNTAQVARAVLDGAAELGFVEGAVDEPLLASTTVAHDRLVIVVSPSHPWATHPPASLADSAWVLREAGSGTRSEFELTLRRLGIDPAALDLTLELPSNEAVRAAVEAGAGATAISELVVAHALRAGRLVRTGPNLPPRTFHALRHRHRYHSHAAAALMAMAVG